MTDPKKPALVVPIGRKGKPPPGPPPKDWRKKLVLTDRGALAVSAWNVGLILSCDERLRDLFRLNEFANRIELQRDPPWQAIKPGEFIDTDLTRLEQWMGSPDAYQLSCKPDLLERCVYAAAEINKVHSVRAYLTGLVWDGVERLPELFPRWFGTADTPYTRQVGLVFGISAVARVMRPGCKVDFMVVLEGVQGAGKTSAVEALFGMDWYAEATESPLSKDFYVCLEGRWCVEIAEMHAFSKADVTRVKQAVTARNDVFRAPYAKRAESHYRQCVFVGTTNTYDWQRDETGGRRYYPIRTGSVVHVGELRALRDQIWAEAVARFSRGEPWHTVPEGAADIQDGAFQEDGWTDPIGDWLDGQLNEKHYVPQVLRSNGRVIRFSLTDMLDGALGMEVAKQTRAEQNRAAAVLRYLGWETKRVEVKGRKYRYWHKPGVATDPPPDHPDRPSDHPADDVPL